MTYLSALAYAARDLADRIDALVMRSPAGPGYFVYSDAHCWDDDSPVPRWTMLAATITHGGWRVVPVSRLVGNLGKAVDRRIREEDAGRAARIDLDACLDGLLYARLRGSLAALNAATELQRRNTYP